MSINLRALDSNKKVSPIDLAAIMLRRREDLIWNRCHQISGYEANQAIDSIPACWIAICEKLLFSLNVICIECVVLISITIIYFGVRNTYQFHHLQTGSCLRTLTTARASS